MDAARIREKTIREMAKFCGMACARWNGSGCLDDGDCETCIISHNAAAKLWEANFRKAGDVRKEMVYELLEYLKELSRTERNKDNYIMLIAMWATSQARDPAIMEDE